MPRFVELNVPSASGHVASRRADATALRACHQLMLELDVARGIEEDGARGVARRYVDLLFTVMFPDEINETDEPLPSAALMCFPSILPSTVMSPAVSESVAPFTASRTFFASCKSAPEKLSVQDAAVISRLSLVMHGSPVQKSAVLSQSICRALVRQGGRPLALRSDERLRDAYSNPGVIHPRTDDRAAP